MANLSDDAPPTTSKSRETRDAAVQAFFAARGDALIGQAVTINRPRDGLYAYWRDFAQLPSFMENVERVDVISPIQSHWVVKAPAGQTVK